MKASPRSGAAQAELGNLLCRNRYPQLQEESEEQLWGALGRATLQAGEGNLPDLLSYVPLPIVLPHLTANSFLKLHLLSLDCMAHEYSVLLRNSV